MNLALAPELVLLHLFVISALFCSSFDRWRSQARSYEGIADGERKIEPARITGKGENRTDQGSTLLGPYWLT